MARSARIFWLTLLLILVLFLISSRPRVSLRGARGSPPALSITPTSPATGSLGQRREEKRLVVASEKVDDTTWIQRRLPDWPVSRYIVDDTEANLTVLIKKGRESMVYLTYLIDNYDHLPTIMVFIHSRQYQWHNDDPNKDGATVLSRLQLPYVLSQGYANLRCVWVIGCPGEIHLTNTKDGSPTEMSFGKEFQKLFPEKYAKNEIPDIIGVSCCAQFAVTAARVLEKPRSEYIRIRDWIITTPLEDSVSGRILEYSWHMIFGQSAVHCPDARTCYCKTYGLCDLRDCNEKGCPEQYQLPLYSTIPDGWKPLPEFDSP